MSSSTIFIGSLDAGVQDALLLELFGCFGTIRSFKVIRDSQQHHLGQADPYGFVEYAAKEEAAAAIAAMHRRCVLGKNIRVNWARNNKGDGGPRAARGSDEPHTVFVGDLGPDTSNESLRTAFSKCGNVVECRVVRDTNTGKSRGYGFVSFESNEQANNAIKSMHGQVLENSQGGIRVNWAVRRGLYNNGNNSNNDSLNGQPSFEQVFGQASSSNCTVYCGGMGPQCDENALRRAFLPYGRIVEVRFFRDKGYAFIRFDNKESACNAILALNNEDIFQTGQPVRCAWGREENQHHSNPLTNQVANNAVMSNGVAALKLAQNQAYLQQQQQQQQQYFASQQALASGQPIPYVMPYNAGMAPQLYDANQSMASLQQIYMSYYGQPAFVDANQAFLQDPNQQLGQQQQQHQQQQQFQQF